MINQPRLTMAQALKFVLRFRDLPGFPKDDEQKSFTGEVETVPGPGQLALMRAFQTAALGVAHGEKLCQMLEDGVRVGDDENALHYAPLPGRCVFCCDAPGSRQYSRVRCQKNLELRGVPGYRLPASYLRRRNNCRGILYVPSGVQAEETSRERSAMIAALSTNRKTLYEQHLDDLVKLLDRRPGIAGWEIWNYFAAKHDLTRRDVTDLLERAVHDHWVIERSAGTYYPILSYTDED